MISVRTTWLVLFVGTALGLASRASDLLPREVGWIGNLGAVWLAVAFAVGARAGSRGDAALAGAATLTLAALVHYTSARVLRHGLDIDLFRFPVTQWIVIGATLGAVFGAVGCSGRAPAVRAWAIGTLAATFGAEALYLFLRDEPNAVVLAAPLEIVAFVVLPVVLLRGVRDRVVAALTSVAIAPVGTVVILGVVAVVRRVY